MKSLPKDVEGRGTKASSGKMSVRRSMVFHPERKGCSISHATKLIAMPFIMIVVTTSCAPVLTLSIAGTEAQNIERRHGRQDHEGQKERRRKPVEP